MRANGSSIAGISSISTSKTGTLDAAWELDLLGVIKFSNQAAEACLDGKQNDWHTAGVSLALK